MYKDARGRHKQSNRRLPYYYIKRGTRKLLSANIDFERCSNLYHRENTRHDNDKCEIFSICFVFRTSNYSQTIYNVDYACELKPSMYSSVVIFYANKHRHYRINHIVSYSHIFKVQIHTKSLDF